MLALKEQGQLWTFDEVSPLLRPLDRPELLSQAAGAELGNSAAKHCPVVAVAEEGAEGEEEESEQNYSEDDVMKLAEGGEMMFEDKEYTEDDEAVHSGIPQRLRGRAKGPSGTSQGTWLREASCIWRPRTWARQRRQKLWKGSTGSLFF